VNYSGFVAALSQWGRISNPASVVTFQASLPTIITEAEQRVYRDLDLLATMVSDVGLTISNQRAFTLPQNAGYFVVLHDVNLINGTSRTPLSKINRVAMDMLFPDSVSGQAPLKWAPFTDQTILLGPSPSGVLSIECIGTIRPETLSATNTNTFLSDQLPDLFFSAAMCSLVAYQMNFGAESDNPKMGLSWQQDYEIRLKSADIEEQCRKFSGFRVQ